MKYVPLLPLSDLWIHPCIGFSICQVFIRNKISIRYCLRELYLQRHFPSIHLLGRHPKNGARLTAELVLQGTGVCEQYLCLQQDCFCIEIYAHIQYSAELVCHIEWACSPLAWWTVASYCSDPCILYLLISQTHIYFCAPSRSLNLPSSIKCVYTTEKLGFLSFALDRLKLYNWRSLSGQPLLWLTLAARQLSYFHMDELFLNNFSNVLGTNKLFFTIRNAAGLPFPTIFFFSFHRHIYCGNGKKILLLSLRV